MSNITENSNPILETCKRNKLGLIGFPLGHSFSARYFNAKFKDLGLKEWKYENFPIENIDSVVEVIKNNPTLRGFNVTIPHKLAIIPYLSHIDESAAKIGAVNCVEILPNGELKGYNTDCIGFRLSLEDMLNTKETTIFKALVLGTGGASRAVVVALEQLGIEYKLISRRASEGVLSYKELTDEILESSKIIINTTPLGMSPKLEGIPSINYNVIGKNHFLFDLIFNPSETRFMYEGRKRGATVKNGYEMLVGQAEAWWKILEVRN
ncbi:MAG: shikimate dehydrogenase [Rikenellaceae bacterium]